MSQYDNQRSITLTTAVKIQKIQFFKNTRGKYVLWRTIF